METSAITSMIVSPREGNLKTLYHMFVCLTGKYFGIIVLDPTEPDLTLSKFYIEDWSAMSYNDCVEEIPQNALESIGFGFTNKTFVDSDYAGDHVIRRS